MSCKIFWKGIYPALWK